MLDSVISSFFKIALMLFMEIRGLLFPEPWSLFPGQDHQCLNDSGVHGRDFQAEQSETSTSLSSKSHYEFEI